MALFTIQSEFRYEIVRKVFEGGMGVVYEAEQHGTRNFIKRIAIKVVRQNYADQKQFIDNFIGEAKKVAGEDTVNNLLSTVPALANLKK